MNLTFGICTEFEDTDRLQKMITSIHNLQIPNYEIILAGSYTSYPPIPYSHVRYVLCDGWITKKKNLIAKCAQYETLVLAHDYYVFDPGWYEAWKSFECHRDWKVASNRQLLITGERHFTDWVTWDHPTVGRYYPLEYLDWSHTAYQYVSGGYFLVKRDFLRQHPFNEQMQPGSPEDVEWSLRIRDKAHMICNPDAIVRHNKRHRDAK